jgi:hypothetical protein
MCNFTRPSRHPVTKTSKLHAMTAIAAAILLGPIHAHAEPATAVLKLQKAAATNALELGSAVADDHWTRVEFSKVYDDPVVVIEPSIDNANNTYLVGIRNVDAKGFEINLKSCNNARDFPLQENVNFSVIENGQLPGASQAPVTKQRFAWGECGATRSS